MTKCALEAQGFTVQAETLEDGTLTLVLLNSFGHTLAAGTWHGEAPEVPSLRPADAWRDSA